MLGEAHWCNTIDAYSQDSDEQMDEGDPVRKKRPKANRECVKNKNISSYHPSQSSTEGGREKVLIC